MNWHIPSRKKVKGFRKARKLPRQRQRIIVSRVPSQLIRNAPIATTSHQNIISSRYAIDIKLMLSRYQHACKHDVHRKRPSGVKRGQKKITQQSLRSTFPAVPAPTPSPVYYKPLHPEVLDTLGSPTTQRTTLAKPLSPRHSPSASIKARGTTKRLAKTPTMLTTNAGINSLPLQGYFGEKIQGCCTLFSN